MDKRKVFKICISIFLVFVIMAVIEIAIRGISSGVSNIANNIKEKKEEREIYNSETEVAKRNVKEFVNNVLEALQDEDYDYVTHCLDRRYLKYFFDDDKEKVKSSLCGFLDGDADYQITNVTDSEQRYYVSIGFTSGESFYTKYVTVFGTNTENYAIMFEYCDYIVASDYHTKTDNLYFSNTFTYSANGVVTYPIDITNNSSEDVEIDIVDKYMLDSSGTKIKCDGPENITIKANDKKQIKLFRKKTFGSISYINMNIKVNGQEQKIEMYSNESLNI